MSARNRFTPQERRARSRLAQVLHAQELIAGSVVAMARRCGKKGCHCEHGEKHVSLYLSVKLEGKRCMVYIPPELEEPVRRAVESYRESEALKQVVSEACVSRVLDNKRKRKRSD